MGVFARPVIVPPQTVRLELGDEHWVEVKRELNYGEMQQVARQTSGDLTAADLHLTAAYLVDWSITDAAGNVLPLETDAQKLAALKALSVDAFRAIGNAVEAQVKGVQAEKKDSAPSGRRKSARISS